MGKTMAPLPGRLKDEPWGVVSVVSVSSDREIKERMRDLARAVRGGSVFLLGRHLLTPVAGASGAQHGSLGSDSCEEDLHALLIAVRSELKAQAHPQGRFLRRLSAFLMMDPDATKVDTAAELDGDALNALALRIAEHVSVGPALEAAVQSSLPPALWQPTFVICCGNGQVRVLTFAFAGGPVLGESPATKRTPYVLRLGTPDLVPERESKNMAVCFGAEQTSAQSMKEYLDGVKVRLATMVDNGDWNLTSPTL